ncbi:MAG TPA: protoporphyrinogen oxidase [Opitutaceae bacterium]
MNVAVLGGGVTGLSAAWRLTVAGHTVRVIDSGARLGGVVRTENVDGWVVEAGPTSLIRSRPEIDPILAELGLDSEVVAASPAAANRYLVKNGALVALPTPSDLGALVATPLLGFGAKLKISSEVARSPRSRDKDVSVADLVRDHFGGEVLERVVQPFIGGIFAGDAERLSVQHAFPKLWEAERTVGSLVRAGLEGAKKRKGAGLDASPSIISFRRGLQALPDALAARLAPGSAIPESSVRSIARGTTARWRVDWEGPLGAGTGQFDCVLAALPASSLAALEIGGKRALAGLADIAYPPVASVTLGYARDRVRHPLDGFGALVPATEKRSILGIIFSSSLFPGRAPEGHVALTVFAGGALQPEIARLPPAELIRRVGADLQALLGAQGQPVFVRHTLWPTAIPQYNLGYERHLEAMAKCEKEHPGLLIGGNVRDGISLADCILSGTTLAARAS